MENMPEGRVRKSCRVYLTEDHQRRLAKICRAHSRSAAAVLHPFIENAISQLYANLVDDIALQRKIVMRALRSHNSTLTEIVEYTGLDRHIVQTTLNELVDGNVIWESRGRGKIVNYFPNDETRQNQS
jgi:DNA-binding MarR family transcriptional regulator